MASFSSPAGVRASAQGSRPVAFSADVASAALAAPHSLISGRTGKLRAWRRRAQERAALAQMSPTELHDIGLSSADRWVEINKPFRR